MNMNVNLLTDDAFPDHGAYFPPTLTALLVWSSLFQCSGTFSNYLAFVKTGCLIVGASAQVLTLLRLSQKHAHAS